MGTNGGQTSIVLCHVLNATRLLTGGLVTGECRPISVCGRYSYVEVDILLRCQGFNCEKFPLTSVGKAGLIFYRFQM